MKLLEFPKTLPIETIHEVTSILATLIGVLSDEDVFATSDSLADYQETMDNLNRDLEDCVNLYEYWQLDDNAGKYKDALKKMHVYLLKADALLKAIPTCIH